MPSVALFFSSFSKETEISKKIAQSLALEIVDDETIIKETSAGKHIPENKLKQSLYGKTSVFNNFTLEKERNIAVIKSVLAERLNRGDSSIYQGFISLLIPQDVTHVLKVLVINNKSDRIKLALEEGISEQKAVNMIQEHDQKVHDWANFLFKKEAYDESLYDMVIPVGEKEADDVAYLIKENLNNPAVMETGSSLQAITDFHISANVEFALLNKGHKVGVECHNGKAILKVNDSAFSFTMLTNKLSTIANAVPGVQEVEVVQGRDYRTSIYRKQKFELPPKVLLVDDEREYVETLSERLINRNVGAYAVFDGHHALDFIQGDTPDVMVLDLKMPGINGIEVLKETKKSNPNIEVIILTGHGSEADRKTCMELGAFAYLQKPTDIDKLSGTINDAYRKISMHPATTN